MLTDASPAIGDIYGDGKNYLLELTRGGRNRLICYSMEDNNGDSKPDSKWETPVTGATYRGAILSNLDNSPDGSLEIIACHEGDGAIRVFKADGTEWYTKLGVNTSYAAIAVADLGGDNQKEIIAHGYDGIYVWHYDFTPFGANERIYTINDSNYAYPCGDKFPRFCQSSISSSFFLGINPSLFFRSD